MDGHTDLQHKLVALFLAARSDAAKRLRTLNIPLTVPEAQVDVARNADDPNGWESSDTIVQRNALAKSDIPFFQLAPLLSRNTTSEVLGSASQIVNSFRDHLPFFSPFEGKSWILVTAASDRGASSSPKFEDNEAEWTARHLILPALWEHLAKLPSLKTASKSVARSFASDVLAVAKADDMRYKLTIPLSGITAKSHIVSPQGPILRRLSPQEQGRLFSDWSIATTNFGTALPLVALELTIRTGRGTHNPDPRELVSKWLCALFLNAYDVAGYRAQLCSDPTWALPTSMNIPLSLPPYITAWAGVSSSKFAKITETVRRLERYSVNDPHSEHDLALHRFSSGVARSNHVDGVLDFVIALESLLLPFDENARRGDLGYRFRIHGAHLLSATKSERRQNARRLSDLYNLRSRLVHGSSYPSAADIEAGWNSAKEFARRGLYRAVMDRFPTAEQFNRMTLGA
jgi:hypothetical protein